jgi:transposase
MAKSIRNFSTVTRVGLDLAKRVFQVHAVDAKREIVAARKLTRNQLIPFFAALPPRLVAMEACSSAHHWGRALSELGHEVRLLPPAHGGGDLRGGMPIRNGSCCGSSRCVRSTRPS